MPTIPTARRIGNNYNRARNELLEAALGYAVRGWGYPTSQPDRRRCMRKPDCTRIGKHPPQPTVSEAQARTLNRSGAGGSGLS